MNAEKISSIYERLLSLKLKIDAPGIPNPRYLNEKLGECRVFMDEIEHYHIETYQALSAVQQALNTAIADYETKKESLISDHDEVKNLPSDKARESKANNLLKLEISTIKSYENETQTLSYLLKAITLKNKNLTSDNADLKAHMRIMESQIKLGSGSVSDPAVRGLLEEFKKSQINKDAFEDAETEVSDDDSIDPTAPLDINNLLSQGDGDDLPGIPHQCEVVEDSMIDPDIALDPENNGETPEALSSSSIPHLSEDLIEVNETPEALSSSVPHLREDLVVEEEDNFEIDESPIEGLDIEGADENHTVEETVIDLEQIIDFIQEKHEGGVTQDKTEEVAVLQEEVKIENVVETVVQKQETKEPDPVPDTAIIQKTAPSSGLDLDSLLDDLNLS